MAGRIRIGRIPIDAVGFDESIERITALVRLRRGGCVFTPNVDHVMIAERDARFREAYAEASLSLVDGMPLVWAARLLGSRLPEKISGADLVRPLAARAAQCGFAVYVLGGQPGSAEAAAAALVADYPGLRVVGADAPAIDIDRAADDSASVIARITAARPDLVFVGLGAPKQEIWIHRHRAALGPAVAVAVGAALDFLAGRIRRAPRWMSDAGVEWSYRLAREPRRLAHRYLVRDMGFGLVLARMLAARGRLRSAPGYERNA